MKEPSQIEEENGGEVREQIEATVEGDRGHTIIDLDTCIDFSWFDILICWGFPTNLIFALILALSLTKIFIATIILVHLY